jgi:hypothetical protein
MSSWAHVVRRRPSVGAQWLAPAATWRPPCPLGPSGASLVHSCPLSSPLARSGPSPSLLFSDTALATVHPQTTHTTQTTQASLSPPPSHSAAAALTSPLPFPSSPGRSASTSTRQVSLPLDTRRALTRLPSSPLSSPPPTTPSTVAYKPRLRLRLRSRLAHAPSLSRRLRGSGILAAPLPFSLSISLYLSISRPFPSLPPPTHHAACPRPPRAPSHPCPRSAPSSVLTCTPCPTATAPAPMAAM